MTTDTRTTSPTRRGTVPLLAAGVFVVGTSEFLPAGLLPLIAADLQVPIPAVGTLISMFAIGMLVGAPVMALLTLRLPRRLTLLGALAVFGAAHLLPVFVGGYGVLLVSRGIAAVACATYWAVASLIAIGTVDESRVPRALAALVTGLSLANIVGVPAGTWLGQGAGWKAAFVAVALASLLLFVLQAVAIRDRSSVPSEPLLRLARRELRVLTQPAALVTLGTTAAFQGAVFCAFSYLSPLLTEVAGVPAAVVPLVLLGNGVGMLVGIRIGNRLVTAGLLVTVRRCLLVLAGALLLVLAASWHPVAVIVAEVLLGVATGLLVPAINGRIFQVAGTAPTLASGMNVGAFNVGNAVGPWLGGLAIAAGLGLRAPVVIGIGLVVLALLLTQLSRALERPGLE
ncbi:MFS transporter [Enemella evansiae]|uniref:MFS transporter n=1 Tax=Enemella evansiae TaxID=2016499 RepID=A0A255GCF3_9ACTN|nr:MFS transporter [Enemella evansiae]OYO13567.1 MFS transporter [Enemella evansiae]